MRIPSASFCQRSAILLSSSSAALEYMEKRGPELSPKLGSPCDGSEGGFGAEGDWSRERAILERAIHVGEYFKHNTKQRIRYQCLPPLA
jgi:hypothetical protein